MREQNNDYNQMYHQQGRPEPPIDNQ